MTPPHWVSQLDLGRLYCACELWYCCLMGVYTYWCALNRYTLSSRLSSSSSPSSFTLPKRKPVKSICREFCKTANDRLSVTPERFSHSTHDVTINVWCALIKNNYHHSDYQTVCRDCRVLFMLVSAPGQTSPSRMWSGFWAHVLRRKLYSKLWQKSWVWTSVIHPTNRL